MKMPKSGLYAITRSYQDHTAMLDDVQAAIKGGARIIQHRNKELNASTETAKALLKLCQQYGVPLIINDDIELAQHIGADGVHLGKNDGDIKQARQRLGEHAIIGVSCYNSVPRALAAEQNTADYVAFGRFYASSSKPLAAPADINTLQLAKQSITVPVVAIGGILPENGAALLTAGADLLAVIGGVFNDEPEISAARYQTLFNLTTTR